MFCIVHPYLHVHTAHGTQSNTNIDIDQKCVYLDLLHLGTLSADCDSSGSIGREAFHDEL